MTNPKPGVAIGSLSFTEGSIIDGRSAKSITFDELMTGLKQAQVVYVGEKHTHAAHHEIQLRVIKELFREYPDMQVGMEMFAQPYQPVLDEWSSGRLDEETFLKKVHWYANWKYDFGLYREILAFIKTNRIRLIALNVPFHLPPKISVGGIDTLLKEDRQYLPEKIDTGNTAHRAYVQEVFTQHHLKGRRDFDNFYMAQCVWDEAMAETIARTSNGTKMVVLAGNGHIYRKFGIPQRAHNRTGHPFKTLYPVIPGGDVKPDDADYFWVTAPAKPTRFHRFRSSGK